MIWFSFTIIYSVELLVLKTFSSFCLAAASPIMGPTAFLSAQSLLKQPEHIHIHLQPPHKGVCQGFPSPCTLPPRQYISKSQEFDLAQLLYKNSKWVFASLFCNPGVYHHHCEYFFHSAPAPSECQWRRHTPYFGELAADQSCWTKKLC